MIHTDFTAFNDRFEVIFSMAGYDLSESKVVINESGLICVTNEYGKTYDVHNLARGITEEASSYLGRPLTQPEINAATVEWKFGQVRVTIPRLPQVSATRIIPILAESGQGTSQSDDERREPAEWDGQRCFIIGGFREEM